MSDRLEDLRREISSIDREIVLLLVRRVRAALEIGKIKNHLGMAVEDPEREREVLSHVLGTPHAPLDTRSLETLFHRILTISRQAQIEADRPAQPE